ncbi:MAG: prevent-host-death protein [Caulobacter sp. 12-67-6]|nr:MAG: prevent-host-death protein [Caulobacter sp. 12-67-6]OYX70928.1 MAG: prevent-host-death protein [Caulobacter sp. 32-67-35]HQR89550.1 type II toxin-antitoxin system prevent-host-death family antitoxin [Caulobacter sp.]
MLIVNMHDAKSQLSKLVDAVESGETDEVVIARNGRPAARLVPMTLARRTPVRIGIAKGLFAAPADPNAQDAEVAALFLDAKD